MINRNNSEGGGYNAEHGGIEIETDPYKILGVSRNASPKEVKQAYLGLIKQYHPDTNKDPAAAEIAKKINNANDEVTSNITTSEAGIESDEIFQSAQETRDYYTAKDEILEAASRNDLKAIDKIIEKFNRKYTLNPNYKKGITLSEKFYIPYTQDNEKYELGVWIQGHHMGIETLQQVILERYHSKIKKEQADIESNPDLLISQVQSYKELYSILHSIIRILGPIQWEDQSYTSGQMVKLIHTVKSNPDDLGMIPEIYGIRKKVQELITKGVQE